MRSKSASCCLAVAAFLALCICPSSADEKGGPLVQRGSSDVGFLLVTGPYLGTIDSYEGGLGLKFGRTDLMYRSSLDFYLNGSTESAALVVGFTMEKHFWEGPVSPYWGFAAHAGWRKSGKTLNDWPVSLGVMAGVEVTILDCLALFAEYGISAEVTYETDGDASNGTWDYSIGAGLGNEGRIGIILYIMRAGKRP